MKNAPGMANLVSLCLCQGERTAVGFCLVDQSSNHIDVIIRDLGKNWLNKHWKKCQRFCVLNISWYPFQVISGVWREVYQAVFIKEVQVVLSSHLNIFVDHCNLDTHTDGSKIMPNKTSCKHNRSPWWENLVPERWSWMPGPTSAPFPASHSSSAMRKGW